MISVFDNNSLLSDQDINQFLTRTHNYVTHRCFSKRSRV